MKGGGIYIPEVQTEAYIYNLLCLCDITNHLNKLNFKTCLTLFMIG
jgi:hypothetical protein